LHLGCGFLRERVGRALDRLTGALASSQNQHQAKQQYQYSFCHKSLFSTNQGYFTNFTSQSSITG
jgi:hypothetical protein